MFGNRLGPQLQLLLQLVLLQNQLVLLDLFLEIAVIFIFSMIGSRLQLLFEAVVCWLVFVSVFE